LRIDTLSLESILNVKVQHIQNRVQPILVGTIMFLFASNVITDGMWIIHIDGYGKENELGAPVSLDVASFLEKPMHDIVNRFYQLLRLD
jgi:hypothetical protein